MNTIGMVAVAALAASAADGAADATITATLRPNQIGRQRRHPVELTLRPAIFDRDVPALDEAASLKPLAKRGNRAHRCRGDAP